ncbi:Uncharacterised protein [Chromobacterium violaceum]|uniref:Zinc-ribbon domain-containing protein n=1 Tax=Chromobacterium violaceum TaxID=536 RepID=A0A447TCZ4_CHRVL|nr:Uncharacterised protein [Chromobacterium violaceum]
MMRLSVRYSSIPLAVRKEIESWIPIKPHRDPNHPSRVAFLEAMGRIAHAWGGGCLSSCYKNYLTHLEFCCRLGHTFRATPAVILSGQFCPLCHSHSASVWNEIQEFLVERGWECLSEGYTHSNTSLHWRCEKGHEWKVRWETVRSGSGCPHCYREKRCHSLEDMQQLAASREGLNNLPSKQKCNFSQMLWLQ